MSNELAILDAELPSYLRNRELDDITKALMGGSSQSGKRVSIKGGVWRLMVNGKEVAKNEDRALNIVVANAALHVSRTYYEGTYQEGEDNKSSPRCWSENSDTPAAEVANPLSSRCVDCPMNQKGSGQGDSKACRFSQRLAVLLGNDLKGDIYQLVLPSKSVFGDGEPGKWPLQAYSKAIASKGYTITSVVTEARFDTDSATPKLTFKPIRVLSDAEHALVIERGKEQDALNAISLTVYQQDNGKEVAFAEKPAPVAAPVLEAPKPEVKEEPAPVSSGFTPTVEEVPEPVKVKPKQEEPAEKSDLSQLLADWDDE